MLALEMFKGSDQVPGVDTGSGWSRWKRRSRGRRRSKEKGRLRIWEVRDGANTKKVGCGLHRFSEGGWWFWSDGIQVHRRGNSSSAWGHAVSELHQRKVGGFRKSSGCRKSWLLWSKWWGMVLGETHWLNPPTLARHHSNYLCELFYDRRS